MFRFVLVAALLASAPALADSSNEIPFLKRVELTVGQSMIVHGFRGDCGERPTNVDPNRTRATKLGYLSIGKWGVTKSRTCGGLTPAVEIIFNAEKKGRETIEVAGEKIRVIVK